MTVLVIGVATFVLIILIGRATFELADELEETRCRGSLSPNEAKERLEREV